MIAHTAGMSWPEQAKGKTPYRFIAPTSWLEPFRAKLRGYDKGLVILQACGINGSHGRTSALLRKLGIAMPISPGGTRYDDAELDSLFQAVGFVVVQWGQAEQSLDIITAILYQQLGGKQLAKRVPKMLSTKLEFLSKCVATIPALAEFQTESDALVANFVRLSDRRHDLIHGAIATVSPQDGAEPPRDSRRLHFLRGWSL